VKTIARNATRKIAAIKNAIVAVTVRDEYTGKNNPVSVDAAFAALTESAKLYDNLDGSYMIWVHSNLQYRIYTQDALDRMAAEQAQIACNTASAKAQFPVSGVSTRAERHARIMASTTSIHGLRA